jgi:hypothetical protein
MSDYKGPDSLAGQPVWNLSASSMSQTNWDDTVTHLLQSQAHKHESCYLTDTFLRRMLRND